MNDQREGLAYYWRYFAPYRRRVAGIVLVSVAYSSLEAFAIASLLPVIEQLVDGTDGSVIGRWIRALFDAVGAPFTVTSVLAFVVLLFVLKVIAEYGAFYLGSALGKVYARQTLTKLFVSYAGVRWEYFTQQRVGYLIDVVQQAVRSATFVRSGIQQVSNLLFSFILLGMSFLVAPALTGMALVFFGFALGVIAYAGQRVTRHGASIVMGSQKLSDAMTQYLLGFKTMKAYNAFPRAIEHVEDVAENRESAQLRVAKIDAALVVIPELLFVLALIGSVYMSVSTAGGVAELGVVIALLLRVSQKAKILRSLATLGEYLPAIKLVNNTIKWAGLYAEDVGKEGGLQEGRRIAAFENEIRFDNVSFRYARERGGRTILDLDMAIAKGEFVGIVGPSGAGKSTLSALLLGLLQPSGGSVTVDGDVLGQDIPADAWLALIGYVPQESFLLNATIEKNIAFFRNVSRAEVVRAARLAHVDHFVESLPGGYATWVGENGVELSGGERQRICLARALLLDPPILVLDEATSSLDSASERAIQEAISELRSKVTIVMIAHRLSTLGDADRILVIEHGRLVESGSPNELLTRPEGKYRRMLEIQSGGTRLA